MIGEHRLDWHGYGAQSPYDPITTCPDCRDDCFINELEDYGVCVICWERMQREDAEGEV